MLKPQRKGVHSAEMGDDALFTLVVKLLYMRLKLAMRGLRHSPTAQLRLLFTTAGVSLTCLITYTLFILPSAPQRRQPVSASAHVPAGPSIVGGRVGGTAASTPSTYASELRRRAAELHSEISRFNERESAIVKQRNLWQTAKLLNSELAELKVRQSHLGVPVASATRWPGQNAGHPHGHGGRRILRS